MKKIFMFAAIAAALLSCAKDNSFNQSNDEASSDKVIRTVDLTASYEETLDSKASLGAVSGGKVAFLWNTGDLIKAYINTTAHSTSTVAEDYNNKSSAVLSVEFTQEPDEDDKMMFFFPGKKGDSTIPADGVSFTFPAEQWAAQNGLPTDHNYNKLSAAIADAGLAKDVFDGNAGKLKFKNAFAIVGFAFDETLTDVKKISLSGSKGEVLAGTYTIAPDASVKLDGSKTSYKAATLVYNTGASFASGPNFYIVLAPTVFEEGFTLTLTLADGKILTRTSPKASYDFARSSVNHLGTLSKSMFREEPEMSELWSVANTNPRNLAIDKDYVYLVGAGATNLTAYSLADGSATSMSVSTILNQTTNTFKTSDVKVIDNNGASVVLVSNLAAAGQTLNVYSYSSLEATPAVALSYTVPNGTRLGDKFTVEGNWQSGKLIFHDYSVKNRAYVFTITAGVISSDPSIQTYSTSAGPIGAFYRFGDEMLWIGTGLTNKNDVLVFDNDLNYSSTLSKALPCSTGTFTAAHGLRFFSLYGKSFMAFMQVESGSKSYLNVYSIGDGADFASCLDEAELLATESYATVDADGKGANGNAVGDVAVYTDGNKAYVAALATGLGFTLYEIK